jgi:hypothetical protein
VVSGLQFRQVAGCVGLLVQTRIRDRSVTRLAMQIGAALTWDDDRCGMMIISAAGGEDFLTGLDRQRADAAGQQITPVRGLSPATAAGLARRMLATRVRAYIASLLHRLLRARRLVRLPTENYYRKRCDRHMSRERSSRHVREPK